MSATQNTITQAKGLVESLLLLEENFAQLTKTNLELKGKLKEADANLNALQGENASLKKIVNELTDRYEDEIRITERLKLHLAQFTSAAERVNRDTRQHIPIPIVNKEEPEKPDPTENKGSEIDRGPFYGVRTENGETIIYPPIQCQTSHQLRHFYSLAGLVVPPNKLLERGGVHLRGLSLSARHRLRKHYRLQFPLEPKEPERPFIRDTSTGHTVEMKGVELPDPIA